MFILCVPLVFYVPGASATPVMDIDYPVNADAEQPIHIFVNITSDLPVYRGGVNGTGSGVLISYTNPSNNIPCYDYMELISGSETNGTWTFEIPPQLYKGTLEVSISASDISGDSTPMPPPIFNINLDGPEPARSFPWSIVIMVAFLGIVLVATELIFKPGVYRKTGRQRAKALEEEDRKRESEEQE